MKITLDFNKWFESNLEITHIKDGNWQNYELCGLEVAASSNDEDEILKTRELIRDIAFVVFKLVKKEFEAKTSTSVPTEGNQSEPINTIIRDEMRLYRLEPFESLDDCIRWCMKDGPIVKSGFNSIDGCKSSNHSIITIKAWWNKWHKAIELYDAEEEFENYCLSDENKDDPEYMKLRRELWLEGYNYAKNKFEES